MPRAQRSRFLAAAVAGAVAIAVFGAAAAAQVVFGRAGRRAQVVLAWPSPWRP